ncbi:hypothetical protein [Paenibacillus sp. MBLB4367]|uniref:hypothetical protein n=1 Tax=Paenibacillus sp. MBLB4367 TaxID=3384767 RepID=UPI00390813C7
MWAISGIVVVTAAIAIIEGPSLWKKKWKKELFVFSVMLLSGTALSIALILHIDIPNPLDLIVYLYKPLSDSLLKMLE